MGALGVALISVAVIAVAVLLIIFVRFLFLNWIVSRILSIGGAIAGFVMAFYLSKGEGGAELLLADIIVSTLAYMFWIGPVIFDVEWDGGVYLGWDGLPALSETGGFFMNTVISLMLVGGAYLFLGGDFPAIFFIVPILIFLLNVGFLIYARINW